MLGDSGEMRKSYNNIEHMRGWLCSCCNLRVGFDTYVCCGGMTLQKLCVCAGLTAPRLAMLTF